jgi:hypothetical protein
MRQQRRSGSEKAANPGGIKGISRREDSRPSKGGELCAHDGISRDAGEWQSSLICRSFEMEAIRLHRPTLSFGPTPKGDELFRTI